MVAVLVKPLTKNDRGLFSSLAMRKQSARIAEPTNQRWPQKLAGLLKRIASQNVAAFTEVAATFFCGRLSGRYALEIVCFKKQATSMSG